MKNLAKIFSVLALVLGIFLFMPKTEAYAIPAPHLTQYGITGITDQDGFNTRTFYDFPNNKIETDAAIYIRTRQMGYGSRGILLDGVLHKFQEVESKSIIQNSYDGKIVVGFDTTYKIDNLTVGMHNIEFFCIASTFPAKSISDTATINKL